MGVHGGEDEGEDKDDESEDDENEDKGALPLCTVL